MIQKRIKQRITEVVDFATTESPYRSATKGWINDYVYYQWGLSLDQSSKKGDELVTMSVYWNTGIGAVLFGLVFIVATLLFSGLSLILL